MLDAHKGKQDLLLFFSDQSKTKSPWPFKKPLLTLYLNAVTTYAQAMRGNLSEADALSCLEHAAASVSDAIPELLCYRIELLVREGRIGEASILSLALLQDYPEYPLTPSSILVCLLAAESYAQYASEYRLFENYLYSKPLSPQATLLTFRLFETKKEFPGNLPPEQKDVVLSLQKREEARKYLTDASKSKEAGVIKDRVGKAHCAFQEAEVRIKPLLGSAKTKESFGILAAHLLSLYTEHIESLEKAVVSPFAFNELPALITETAATLSEDLLAANPNLLIDPCFLQECSALTATAQLYTHSFTREFDKVLTFVNSYPESLLRASRSASRGILFAAKGLYESHKIEDSFMLLSRLDETTLKDIDYELALEVAIEKSLCLREKKQTRKAMSLLAWVINSPCVSSLRIKAMVMRAEIYLAMHREELAVKQLESVVNKGGEWGAVAERKLRELEKVHGIS